MIKEQEIQTICEPFFAENPSLFLVDIKVAIGNRINVRFDCDESVTVQHCRTLSKLIENSLDREKEDFELEVSSAGIDFPLINYRQLKKNIGRTVQLTTIDGTIYKGKLLEASETELTIAAEKRDKGKKITTENLTLSRDKIKETIIVISFV